MILIHLTRTQRRKLKELHHGLNNMYISRALRFVTNSPLACRVRNDAMKLGGVLMTEANTKNAW